MTHRTIDPDTAQRMLLSAATNGDRLSDVDAITALTAVSTGSPVHTLTTVLLLQRDGNDVDDDGDLR